MKKNECLEPRIQAQASFSRVCTLRPAFCTEDNLFSPRVLPAAGVTIISLWQWFLPCGSGLAASVSPGNLLEMHILGSYPVLLNQTLWGWGSALWWSQGALTFKNHSCRVNVILVSLLLTLLLLLLNGCLCYVFI